MMKHLPTRWIRLAGVVVAAAVIAAVATHRIDMAAVHRYAARLNGGVAFALLVILPLTGFPASVVHVAAGVRFGVGRGLLLVGISIGIQLLASYAIARRWGGRLDRWVGPLRRRIPAQARASVAVLAVLIPGAPFAAVNYALPLVGVPLRTYLLCCWPLHLLRATITVTLGGESAGFTPLRLAVLGGYAVLLVTASGWAYRQLRRRLGDPSPAEGDRTQPV